MPERSSHTWHGAGTCSCPAVPCELHAYRAPAPDATQLNADITAAEVESALRWAKRGKAAGHDGLSADLLKDAAPVLLEEYVYLFNFRCLRAITLMRCLWALSRPCTKVGT